MHSICILVCNILFIFVNNLNAVPIENNGKITIPFNLSFTSDLTFMQGVEIALKDFSIKQCGMEENILYKEQCYNFGYEQSSYCKENEVIVLVKPDEIEFGQNLSLKVGCKNLNCTSSSIWWAPFETCVDKNKFDHCGNGYPHIDLFGEIRCKCSSKGGTLNNSDICYEYYQRGPCHDDDVFILDPTTKFGKCSRDLCKKENRQQAGTDLKKFGTNEGDMIYEFAPMNGTGQCFRLFSDEGCEDGKGFILHPQSKIPMCLYMKAIGRMGVIGGVRCPGNKMNCHSRVRFVASKARSLKDF